MILCLSDQKCPTIYNREDLNTCRQMSSPPLGYMQEHCLRVIFDNILTGELAPNLVGKIQHYPLNKVSLSGFTTGSKTVSSWIFAVVF